MSQDGHVINCWTWLLCFVFSSMLSQHAILKEKVLYRPFFRGSHYGM